METVLKHKIGEVETKRNSGCKIIILLITLILIFILSFALGRYPVPPGQLLEVLAARVLPLEQAGISSFEIMQDEAGLWIRIGKY